MLSNTSKYALRAVIYLAIYGSPQKKIGIKKISSELGIPSPFLGKILQVLARHKILNSTKGPNGGFSLEKPAYEISLMDVVKIMDGGNSFDNCMIRTAPCSHHSPCSIHDKVAPMRNDVKRLLQSESIADLAAEFRQGKERIRI